MPFKSLTEAPTGKAVNERILAGLRGEGVGFGEDFERRATSPFVASREARFEELELPRIESEFGARGLSRSTLAGRDVGKAVQSKERDINELIAQARLVNLQQQKSDIRDFMDRGFSFAEAEARVRQVASADEMSRRKFQIGEEEKRDLFDIANVNQLVGAAGSFASPFIGGGIDQLINFAKSAKRAKPSAGQAKPFFNAFDAFREANIA